jgi:hypothetical protein
MNQQESVTECTSPYPHYNTAVMQVGLCSVFLKPFSANSLNHSNVASFHNTKSKIYVVKWFPLWRNASSEAFGVWWDFRGILNVLNLISDFVRSFDPYKAQTIVLKCIKFELISTQCYICTKFTLSENTFMPSWMPRFDLPYFHCQNFETCAAGENTRKNFDRRHTFFHLPNYWADSIKFCIKSRHRSLSSNINPWTND